MDTSYLEHMLLPCRTKITTKWLIDPDIYIISVESIQTGQKFKTTRSGGKVFFANDRFYKNLRDEIIIGLELSEETEEQEQS